MRYSDDERELLERGSGIRTPESRPARSDMFEWVPGAGEQFPWIGALGLLCVLVGMILATVILCLSDHKIVSEWPSAKYKVGPNVLINLANQLSSLGLITAIMQGMAIAWWRKAVRGTTLNELHRSASYSTSFMAVLLSGKHFNKIALAALMAKFPIIDSTLFQQATRTGLQFQPHYHNSTLQAWIETQWPQGVGGIPGTDGETRTVDTNFANIINAFNAKIGNDKVHDTETLFVGCPPGQLCSGQMDVLGFSFDCATEVTDIDYGKARLSEHPRVAMPFVNTTNPTYPLWTLDFMTEWADESKPYASINLTMLYANTALGPNNTCPGTMTKRTCSVRPAVVRYPVSVLAGDVRQSVNVTHLGFSDYTLKNYTFSAPMTDSQIDGIQVLNNTDLLEHRGNISTVAAITFALNNLFQSSVNVTWNKDWDLSVWGSRAQSQFPAESTEQIALNCNYTLDHTARGVADPFIQILRQVNTFAFISALYLSGAPSVPHAQRVQANFIPRDFPTSVSGYIEEYKTNYVFLGAGIVTTLLTLLGVIPVYWGFWQLGRKVTLGPIEVANAFDAPIFGHTPAKNGDIDELMTDVGSKRVMYGYLPGKNGHLGFAEPNRVERIELAAEKHASGRRT